MAILMILWIGYETRFLANLVWIIPFSQKFRKPVSRVKIEFLAVSYFSDALLETHPNISFSLFLLGYYADIEMNCQGYHVCLSDSVNARKWSFLCPNGTIFNQPLLTCDWW